MFSYQNVDMRVRGDTLVAEIEYPRNETSPIKAIEVGLCDVRAADSIRVSYDFGRDGWKIEQAQHFEWEAGDGVCDPGWKEVGFIQAWGSKVTPKEGE